MTYPVCRQYHATVYSLGGRATVSDQFALQDELRAVVVAMNDKLKQGITVSGSKVKDGKGFFKALDTDNSGSLTKAELSKGLKRLKMPISEKLLDDLVSAGDVNRSRRLESKEFIRLLDPSSWTDSDRSEEDEDAQREKILKEVTGKIKFTLKAGGRTLYGKRVTDARTFYEAVDRNSARNARGFETCLWLHTITTALEVVSVGVAAEETVVEGWRRTSCS